MVHRGPNGSGLLRDGNVSLGMRRLAIIDVERPSRSTTRSTT